MHTLHTSVRRETIETHPDSSQLHTNTSRTITHERKWNKSHTQEYNIHSSIHQMNTVQGFGTILSVLFLHENKLHNVSSTLLCSTDLSDLLSFFLYYSVLLQCNNEKLSKDWLHELSRPVCNLSYQTLSGYLLCPITITNSYCQIRVNTQYLQSLTVLHDFTNKLHF
jgi:hypothetical protein